jgi:hypothetical protein
MLQVQMVQKCGRLVSPGWPHISLSICSATPEKKQVKAIESSDLPAIASHTKSQQERNKNRDKLQSFHF